MATSFKLRSDSSNVERARNHFDTAEGEHIEFCQDAKRKLNMFHGKEIHDSKDIAIAVSQQRPLVHIPLQKPMIKLVAGVQMLAPVECTVKPFEGGDEKIASGFFSPLLKYVQDRQYMEMKDSQVFASGITLRRGFYALDVDYSFPHRLNGQFIINEEDPQNVMLDPSNKRYDQSDAQFILRLRAMNKRQIAMKFGRDKADQIVSSWFTTYWPAAQLSYNNNPELELFLVVEDFWRDYTEVQVLMDFATDKEYEIENGRVIIKGDEQIEETSLKVSELLSYFPQRFKKSKYIKPKVMQTVICGDVELAHGEGKFNDSPYCSQNWPIIPYMPNYLYGQNSCFMDDLKDLQRIENISNSLLLHMLNSAANQIWAYTQDSVLNEEELRNSGSSPNFILKLAKDCFYNTHAVRVPFQQVPQVDKIVDARGKAKEATLLNTEFLSVGGGKNMSGRAINLKQQSALTSIATETMPHMWSKVLVGKFLLGMIQSKMRAEQAMRIINKDDIITKTEQEEIAKQRAMQQVMMFEQQAGQILPEQKIEIMQQATQPLDPKELEQMVGQYIAEKLSDYDVTQYDIVAEIKPRNATIMDSNFEKIHEAMKEMGPTLIDPEVYFENMDVPGRQKLIDNVKKQKEMASQPPPMAMAGAA